VRPQFIEWDERLWHRNRSVPLEDNFRQAMLVRVADDMRDTAQGSDFLGSALRIAAGDDDAGLGILALNAADGGAGILISGRGHCAGIEYDDRGLARGGGARKAEFLELTFERGAVGLGGAATEVFYVISGHISMLAHRVARIPTRGRFPLLAKLARKWGTAQRGRPPNQAEAAGLRAWKHSRQNTGRPCVGRNGTVVSLPHPEQTAWVSTLAYR